MYQRKRISSKNDSINVAVFPYYPPYQFKNNQGEIEGIFIDYLELIEKKINYKFKKVYYDDWSKLIEDAKSNKIDLILEIQHTKDKESFLFFYPPLFESKHVIVQKKNEVKIQDLNNFRNRTLVLPDQYSVVEKIRKKHPSINIELEKNDLECLKKVNSGIYDAYVGPKAVIHYLINKNNLKNLSVSSEIDLTYSPGFAVTKKDLILQSIIEKSFRSISNKEKKAILDNWLFNVVTPFYEKQVFGFGCHF
ncbi:MAG: transporter substrate-binding domain-containing protein [Flavobacterium sp.]|nr:transporter substrate-binding domain-containing protein [Flavobacterium sp.]